MINSSLCYIYRGDEVLMLHRTRKENDINRDKWIGLGGKFEEGESPEDCVLREVREETGLVLTSWQYRGIVTFVSDRYETEYMHLFTSDDFEGEMHETEASEEAGAVVIRFDDEWYRTADDYFAKAQIGGELLTTLYEELYGFEVM